MKIRTKSTIIFLILSLAPIIVIGAIAYKNGEEAIRRSLGLSFQQIAHETIDKVDRSLYDVYRNAQTWSGLEIMQEVITQDIDGKISSFLRSLNKEYGYFVSINVLDAQGKAVASSNPELIDKDFAQENYFKDAIKDKKYLGDIHLDKLTKAWVVTFSFPIRAGFEEDKIIGVLCANWHAGELQAITQIPRDKNIEENYGHVMLLRGDGLVISAPRSEEKTIFKRDLTRMGLKSVLFASRKKEGYLVETDEHNRKSLIGYTYSRGYRDFPGFGWIALVVQETKITFALIERFKVIVFSIGILVALFVIIISLILTQKMTGPILKISQVATRVAKGDFEGKVIYISDDEIGSLTKVFNKMVLDLKEQRAQLVDKEYVDSIIANMVDALIVVDNKGAIRTINKATLDLLGYRDEELIGKSIYFLFPEEKISLMGIKAGEIAEIGQLRNYEVNIRSKDDKEIPVIFSSGLLKKIECSLASDCLVLKEKGRHDESILGAVCVVKDITERKWMEEDLRKAYIELRLAEDELIRTEKLAALGRFSLGVAHEVKNPLAIIISGIELLETRLQKADSRIKADLEKIKEAVYRADNIVMDLLRSARPPELKIKRINASDLINEVISLFKHKLSLSNIEIKSEFTDGIYIEVDTKQIQQVIFNVLLNAIDAMPKGGEIKIKTYKLVLPELSENKLSCVIEIIDSGEGISRQNLSKVCEPFFTTKRDKKGTGLGLYISKTIIDNHKGDLTIESESGKGTDVKIFLPVA